MASAPEETRDQQGGDAESPANAEKGSASVLGTVIVLVSLAATALTLVGLGVALSVEKNFGLPQSMVYDSALDLIQLSVWGVAHFFTGALASAKNLSIYLSAVRSSGIIVAATFLGWILVVVAIKYLPRWNKKLGGKSLNQFRISVKEDGIWKLARAGAVFSALAWVLATLGQIVMFLGVIAGCAIIALIPILSMATGDVHIEKYVIKPEVCFPIASREQRLSAMNSQPAPSKERRSAAACVRVLDGRDVVAEGRVVFSTSSRLVLYDPFTGAVQRIPASSYRIEVVPTLQPPLVAHPAPTDAVRSPQGT